MGKEGALVGAGAGFEFEAEFHQGVERAGAGVCDEEEGAEGGIFEEGLPFIEAGEGEAASLPCFAAETDFVELEGEAE